MRQSIGLFALVVMSMSCGLASQGGSKQISADELERLLEKKDVFFLDVREPSEIAQSGSVKGYVNIPLGQLEGRLKEVPRNKLIVTL